MFKEMDENGSMTWSVSESLIEINYYHSSYNLTSMIENLTERFEILKIVKILICLFFL